MALKSMEPIWFTAPNRKIGERSILWKDSPTPPTPPDPYATANAQTNSNISTANANATLNRVNQYTPFGSLTYSQSPGQKTFDQSAYDAALQKYNASKASPQNTTPVQNPGGLSSAELRDYQLQNGQNSLPVNSNITAPNKADFYSNSSPDQWSSSVNLSPAQQSLLDSSNRISQSLANTGEDQLGRVGASMGQPLNFDNAPKQVNHIDYGNIQNDVNMNGVPSLIGGDDLNKDLATQRDSLYNQQAAYLDPQWASRDHDLENKLVQQGITQNSDAWNRAIDEQNRNKTFDYNQARQSAITGGGAEQSRLFGMGLAANQNAYEQNLTNAGFHNQSQIQGFGQGLQNANLQNQGRAENINEIMALRQNPLNELNALRTGSQVTTPQFGTVPGASVAGTNVADAINNAYNAQMGQYNAAQQSNNGITSGLFNLGSVGLPSILKSFLPAAV